MLKRSFILVFCLLLSFFLCSIPFTVQKNSSHGKWPLLAIVIMVKNEEAVIAPTLEPYLKAGVDAVLVFDTGSTDKTIEKAKELFDRYHLKHGYVVQEPFIDFATSRNHALELAEKQFPDALFFLMPDAEWYIHEPERLMQYCAKEAESGEYNAYFLHIFNELIDFYVPRLLRAHTSQRFIGVVHEAIPVTEQQAMQARLPESIYFELRPSHYGNEKSQQRWKRDLQLLLTSYRKDPKNPHTTFYLAQTYECLSDYESAYKYYGIRIGQKQSAEDDYVSFFRRATMADQLHQRGYPIEWKEVMDMYLKAYAMRPCRAEALIKIAEHYARAGEMELAYLFAHRAAEIPYPFTERIFIPKELYTTTLYEILSMCSWKVGAFTVGEEATKRALQRLPHSQALKTNLAIYQQELAKQTAAA